MIKLLDHGYVHLVETWGSDERIIEAARMSTNKGFQGWGPIHTDECLNLEVPFDCCCDPKEGDEKLLRFLYTHKHMTPFEMAGMVIEVQAPIMVFREWHRHRTQSFNEMSGRYTELPDLYYIPDVDRIQKQSKANKQGSDGQFDFPEAWQHQQLIKATANMCRGAYETMLKAGVAREIARLVLPVNQYSRMRASANLRNWLAFLTLRLDKAAQWEIRQYAKAVALLISEAFPRTYGLFAAEHNIEPLEYRSNP
jgi:thymidylate synthase (FAD)